MFEKIIQEIVKESSTDHQADLTRIKKIFKDLLDVLKTPVEQTYTEKSLSADEGFQKHKKFMQLSAEIRKMAPEAIQFLGPELQYLRTPEDLDRLYRKRIEETRKLEAEERKRRNPVTADSIQDSKRKLEEFLKILEKEFK